MVKVHISGLSELSGVTADGVIYLYADLLILHTFASMKYLCTSVFVHA